MKTNFVSEDLLQRHENEWLAIGMATAKTDDGGKCEFFPARTDRDFARSMRDLAEALTSSRN